MMLMRRIGFVAMCSFPLLSCFWETASFPTECTKSFQLLSNILYYSILFYEFAILDKYYMIAYYR